MSFDPRIKAQGAVQSSLLFDMVVDLDPRLDFGLGPVGRRVLFGSAGGRFDGPKIRGEVLPGGGDWTLSRSTGVMTLDVRLTLRLDNGGLILMTYGGRWRVPDELAEDARDPVRRYAIDPSRYYFRTNPLFETGSSDHAWLNDIVCIGKGYLVDGGIAYAVYEVA